MVSEDFSVLNHAPAEYEFQENDYTLQKQRRNSLISDLAWGLSVSLNNFLASIKQG